MAVTTETSAGTAEIRTFTTAVRAGLRSLRHEGSVA
jgi:hypothetical protein